MTFKGRLSSAGLHATPLVLVIELGKKPVFVIKSTGDLFLLWRLNHVRWATDPIYSHYQTLLTCQLFFSRVNTLHQAFFFLYFFFLEGNLLLHTVQCLIKTRYIPGLTKCPPAYCYIVAETESTSLFFALL